MILSRVSSAGPMCSTSGVLASLPSPDRSITRVSGVLLRPESPVPVIAGTLRACRCHAVPNHNTHCLTCREARRETRVALSQSDVNSGGDDDDGSLWGDDDADVEVRLPQHVSGFVYPTACCFNQPRRTTEEPTSRMCPEPVAVA
ncbi:hypothetical protein DPEC_G00076640 [Dallia pectoralis]|uniref:Uncharacterized protein n=1 Tax=Dallia pectoralis TaxID=75939 RepID=A0ACC2H3J1_DALPE|nr:hypothetical protein DPEC_G00076640 [Dallia pectoralis]